MPRIDRGRAVSERVERPLGHYRVLELPGIASLLTGKAFADLGADVIRVEPPGGDPVRRLPPLVESRPGAPGLISAASSIGRRPRHAHLEAGGGAAPPLKPSVPFQSYLHASMQAVAATLVALRNRERTGKGAHVDQAVRDTGIWMLAHTYQFWDLLGVNLRRLGASRDLGGVRRLRTIHPCRDGHVVWLATTGHIGGGSMRALVDW